SSPTGARAPTRRGGPSCSFPRKGDLMPARPHDLRLGTRRGTYTLVIGVVIGMLAAGLGSPFPFGSPLHQNRSGGALVRPAAEGAASSDAGAGAGGSGAAGSTSGT